MLSFLLRPATCGISTFGACDVSGGDTPPPLGVDEEFPATEPLATVEEIAGAIDPAPLPGAPADSICCSPLLGLASFAAQPPVNNAMTAVPARIFGIRKKFSLVRE